MINNAKFRILTHNFLFIFLMKYITIIYEIFKYLLTKASKYLSKINTFKLFEKVAVKIICEIFKFILNVFHICKFWNV